jgi:hypothetical protein
MIRNANIKHHIYYFTTKLENLHSRLTYRSGDIVYRWA